MLNIDIIKTKGLRKQILSPSVGMTDKLSNFIKDFEKVVEYIKLHPNI